LRDKNWGLNRCQKEKEPAVGHPLWGLGGGEEQKPRTVPGEELLTKKGGEEQGKRGWGQ